jgi:hypothetical protein
LIYMLAMATTATAMAMVKLMTVLGQALASRA